MSVKESALIIAFVLATMFCWNSEAKVVLLPQNAPAPFSGYLFDEASQTKAQIAVRQVDEYVKLVELDKKIISEQKSQIQNNQTMNWLYFIGGAVLGGVVGNSIHK